MIVRRIHPDKTRLYLPSALTFLFLAVAIGFAIFGHGLERLTPTTLFLILTLLSFDRMIAKPEELLVKISPFKCPGFYGESWIVPIANHKKIKIDGDSGMTVIWCESFGGIFVPAYQTKSQSMAEGIATTLSGFYTK